MENEKYLCLFADCKLTKGFSRTLAVDLTRGKTYILENDAHDFLVECRAKPFAAVLATYHEEEQIGINELVSYLIEKDLCFFTESPKRFPPMSDHWDSPSIITNAIIDIDEKIHDFKTIIPQLTELGCYDLQLRFFSQIELKELEDLVAFISDSSIKSVEFFLKSDKTLSKKALRELTKRYFKIKNLIIHSHSKNEIYIIYAEKFRNNMGNIIFLTQNITDESHCGVVSPHYFVNDNLQFYTEGLKHNSCLNRKISIDKNGEIKNCPSLKQGYGNYLNVKLKDALLEPKFKSLWNITKSEISVCKDCEYRNVCTDCRAFIADPSNVLSKPAKCNYDPYTAKWTAKKKIESEAIIK